MLPAEILFWFSLLALGYSYAGYPLVIGLLARFFPAGRQQTAPPPASASVIISCFGETAQLAEKIRQILASDGAERIREILIGLDGAAASGEPPSTDPRVKIFPFPERRGKPAVLNDLIPHATGEILVMMDVRQRLDAAALNALLENFSDPAIGVVSGELVFESGDATTADASSIDMYWKLEKWLRLREARYASVPGATGALYAMRRKLAQPIPPEAALDDVLLPMRAIAQGYRCIFEPAARIYDRPAKDAAREAIRKRRTLAGCVQLLKFHPRWVLPFGHPIWWQFASHKIARLFSPMLLMLAGVTNALLLPQPLYAALGGMQIMLYALAIAGMKRSTGKIRPLGVFLHMQGTLLQAWRDGLTRRSLALWDKPDD